LDATGFDYGTLADATLSHVEQICIGLMHSNCQVTVVLTLFCKTQPSIIRKSEIP